MIVLPLDVGRLTTTDRWLDPRSPCSRSARRCGGSISKTGRGRSRAVSSPTNLVTRLFTARVTVQMLFSTSTWTCSREHPDERLALHELSASSRRDGPIELGFEPALGRRSRHSTNPCVR